MQPAAGKDRVRRPPLWVWDLGRGAYAPTHRLQLRLAEARGEDRIPDALLFVEHEPVFTLGRHGRWSNLLASREALGEKGIACVRTERGGDITYHGPGQIVGYPILRVPGGPRNVRAFVEGLETVLLDTLERFGIRGRRDSRNPGVWIGEAKIGAIGLAVRKGVSFHGFALNVCPHLAPFGWIHPCGLEGVAVTSMEVVLGMRIPAGDVAEALLASFCRILGYRPRRRSHEDLRPWTDAAPGRVGERGG